MIITPHMSCLTTGSPDKEHTSWRIPEGPKGGRRLQPIICPPNLLETLMLESRATERCARHQKGPESDRTWQRHDERPETTQNANPIAVNRQTAGCTAEQVSLAPSLQVSTLAPLPSEVFCFVSMSIFWDNSFLSVKTRAHSYTRMAESLRCSPETMWWWLSCSAVSDSCGPMDCSPPGSSVHRIFQARILGCHFLLQGSS